MSSFLRTSFLFFLSLLLARGLTVHGVDLLGDQETWGSFFRATLNLGAPTGVIRDLFIAFLPGAMGALLFALGLRKMASLVAIVLTSGFWLICSANAGNALFFGRPLSLNLVLSASDVAWDVRETVVDFLRNPAFALSTGLFFLTLYRFFRAAFYHPFSSRQSWWGRPEVGASTVSPWRGAAAAVFLVALFFFQQIPIWAKTEVRGSALSDQPVVDWFSSAVERYRLGTTAPSVNPYLDLEKTWPGIYEEFKNESWGGEHPHAQRLGHLDTRALRQELGLDPDRAPNIVFLVAESARALEFLGFPELGAPVYPNLTRYLQRKGIVFEQTYTSATWTSKGLFQMQCGIYDSAFVNPTVYRRLFPLKEHCLPETLKESGYRTYSMRAFNRFFDGAFQFESAHGIDHFFDNAFLKAENAEEAIDAIGWGISDEFFFPKVNRLLSQLTQEKGGEKPFYTYILPVGGHTPWHPASRAPMDPAFEKNYEKGSQYYNYLGRFRIFDQSVTRFLETLDQDPKLKNTVVFILGDHGSRLEPPNLKIEARRKDYLLHRTMAVVVTPGMKKVLRSRAPVHQVDFTVLAAALAGTSPARTPWLGRSPLVTESGKLQARAGTPWLDAGPYGLRYVLPDRVCYSEAAGTELALQKRLRCFRLERGQDPFLAENLQEIPDQPELSAKLLQYLRASDARIEFGGAGALKEPWPEVQFTARKKLSSR